MVCDPNFGLLFTYAPFIVFWDRLEPSRLLSAATYMDFSFFLKINEESEDRRRTA
jgi:hypothetical protein